MLPPPHFLPPGPAPLRCACVWANTWLPRSQSSNGGGRRRSGRLPVSGRGPLRLLPAQPGLFRFGVCRRSPASVGDSQQPATPRIRAFRAPQRYLHLLGLGASATAGQGKASRTVGGGRPPGLGLGVPQALRHVARHRAWPLEARGEETRSAAAARSGPTPPAPCAACPQGSKGGLGPIRRAVDPSPTSGLYRVFAPRPAFAWAPCSPRPQPPQGATFCRPLLISLRFSEPWLLTEDGRGATLLFSDPYLTHRLCSGQLESTSLVSGHPHPPPLGAG